MLRLFAPLIVLVAIASAQEPIVQATEARLWLKVPPGQPPLGAVSVSPGSASQASWEKDPAVRVRHTDIRVPVRWWQWAAVTIRFTPTSDGTVDLDLNGPWAQESNGSTPRGEILWDDLSATGTNLQNGGFEAQTGGLPEHWRSPWAPPAAPSAWPLSKAAAKQGNHVAATWSKRPLVQTLQLKAGVPVTLKLHALAASPPDFKAPKLLGPDTPAHHANARIKRGVNLGNGFEAPPGQGWGVKFTIEDIDHIAAEGFDHIRVPVAWHFRLTETNGTTTIDPAFLAELEPLLRRALEKKLHVILNWHHFNDLTKDPIANRARFIHGWAAIAEHFRTWPETLWFEMLNEPCDALDAAAANALYPPTLGEIRKSNPKRIIVVSPANWGSVSELDSLRLPDDDNRLIVTFHCYEPFHFTHQGAGWTGLTALRGVRYPGPPETPLPVPESLRDNGGVRAFIEAYNTRKGEENPSSIRPIRARFDEALAWSRHFGRPVHLGEFGAHNPADDASRSRYLKDVRTLAEERRIPWTLWEWKSGFGYWDPANNHPRFRAALLE